MSILKNRQVRIDGVIGGRYKVTGSDFIQHFDNRQQAAVFAAMNNYEIVGSEPAQVGAGPEDLRNDPARQPLGTAADVLAGMAQTFRERNAVYGSNYRMIGPMMKILFPDGVPSELVTTHQFHLFELMLVKLSRFAISNLTHIDSVHDCSVYGAMCESILINKE